MSKRPFQKYAAIDAPQNAAKRALPDVSLETRQNVRLALDGEVADDRVTNTSSLLVAVDLPLIKGGTFRLQFFDPVLLVEYVLERTPTLRTIYADKCQQCRGPRQILMGFDEHTPGNQVSHDNRRKCMCVFFNFAELGSDALEIDNTWFTPMVVPAKLMSRVSGGWSCILKHFLRRMTLGPSSFRIAGIMVQTEHTSFCVKGSLKKLLTDGEGWMKALEWNGYSSLRPCWRHVNMFKKGSNVTDETLGYVDITCSEPEKLRPWTPSHLRHTIDEVLSARRSLAAREVGWNKTRVKKLITTAGFCPTQNGMLADAELCGAINLIRTCTYDWMHCSFQEGFMSISMWLFVEAASKATRGNVLCEDIAIHIDACQFPLSRRSQRKQLRQLFEPTMVKVHTKKRSIVANASPQMTLYLILKDYALKVVTETPGLQEHAAVYIAACDIIDVLRKVKHRCLSTQEAKPRMVAAISKFMHLHKVLYGTGCIRPKFGWLWAIAFSIADCEWLFDMWCIERQHRRVKVQAELVRNTTCFATSVLMRVFGFTCC